MKSRVAKDFGQEDLIVITGPTGVGKTELSLLIAERLNAEIINCDSRQLFRDFNIGTAKPTWEQQQRVAHHLLDWLEPHQRSNASDFAEKANRIITELRQQNKRILLVGGTGFYIKAVLFGLFDAPATDTDMRDELREQEEQKGPGYLHRQLTMFDPESAQRIHPADVQRTIRALALYYQTGKKISDYQREHQFREKNYPFRYFYLLRDRDDLYRRIDRRVETMLCSGWLDEIQKLLGKGVSLQSEPMSSIGYQQLVHYLQGSLSLDEAKTLIQQGTRRYAKRQMAWFKKVKEGEAIFLSEDDSVENVCLRIMELLL